MSKTLRRFITFASLTLTGTIAVTCFVLSSDVAFTLAPPEPLEIEEFTLAQTEKQEPKEEPKEVVSSEVVKEVKEVIPYVPAKVKTTIPECEELTALTNYLEKLQSVISVSYLNVATGAELNFRADKNYNSGSVIKAAYCKSIESKTNDTDVIQLKRSDMSPFEGSIEKSMIGNNFTTNELLKHTLSHSDNTSYKMLRNTFGTKDFSNYMSNLGLRLSLDKDGLCYMNTTAANRIMLDIYNSGDGKTVEYMKDTSFVSLIPKASSYTVAHKYGNNNGSAGLHDSAIVYAESPYILSIFSCLSYNDKTVEVFHYVTKMLEYLNDTVITQ